MAGIICNVAVITKINSIQAEEAARRITKLLSNRNVKVYCVYPLIVEEYSTSKRLEELKRINLDLIFAIGGDGTTLRAFRIIPCNIPVFSMNIGGNRGILAEAGVDSIDDAINAILAGRYFYDSRLRIQASAEGTTTPAALNDFLFTRINLTRTPTISIRFRNDEIKQRMDGILVSTPTGSTGHSFSIGSPVLHEGMSCLMLSPIASVNRMPQLIIPTEEEVEIKSTHDANLIIDGQEIYKVIAGQSVKISRFYPDAQFIRLRKKGMRQLAKLGF
jgi:NAD+ kinase